MGKIRTCVKLPILALARDCAKSLPSGTSTHKSGIRKDLTDTGGTEFQRIDPICF